MSVYDFNSPADRRRFYMSNEWRGANGIRNKVLRRDGECLWCKENGKVTTKEQEVLEVDHIVPLEEAPKDKALEYALDMDNLRTLC